MLNTKVIHYIAICCSLTVILKNTDNADTTNQVGAVIVPVICKNGANNNTNNKPRISVR